MSSINLKRLNKKKVIGVIVIVLMIVVLSIAGIFGYNIYRDTEAFDAKKLLSSEASQIFDSQGHVIYTFGSDENGKRQNITYDDLPQVLVDAVVAAEDSRFFEHDGFDLPRIVKAAFSNLVAGGITGGGSTITQQLIKKTYFPNAEKTYTRKISEIILAIQADKELTKEEIITLYLNKIYFGRSTDSIGIAAACKYYFNKNVNEITLPEAAMLAGSLNSPSNYDPYYNLNKATIRRNKILDLMVRHGYISQDECDQAKQVKIENTLCQSTDKNDSVFAAYVDMVVDEVKEKTGLNPKETQMNIHTYCDGDIQTLCAQLGNGEKYSYSDEDLRMGGCVQSSQDGRVIAVIGGRNYQFGDFNYAKQKQQPGSSVKPFLDYGLAFENLDWCTGHSLVDEPFTRGNYSPKNWDGQFHGLVTVSNALENSWNIPALKTYEEVEKKIKASGVKSAMESIGISMEGEEPNLSYGIGGWSKGISPQEMASAYATISNNGEYVESHTVNYIENVQTGEKYNIDEDIQKDKKQSDYSKASAFMVRETMLEYTKNGSGSYAYLSGISNIGAKTGTSNWPSGASKGMAGKSRDAWMSAFTKDYVCSVWMGFGQEGIEKGKTTSRYKAYPGKVLQTLWSSLKNKETDKTYPGQPDDVVKASIVKGIYPYVSPAEGVPQEAIVEAWFKKGTTPTTTSNGSEYNLNQLSSFTASLDSSHKINVAFAKYNPENATTDEKATIATQLFGKVVYTVQVLNESGGVVHTQNFNTPTGTLNYTPTGNVKVVGYYSYERAADRTSNKIEVPITISSPLTSLNGTVSANGVNVENGSTIHASAVTATINANSSTNTFKIVLKNFSGQELASSNKASATFSNLTAGSYTLTMYESNEKQTVNKSIAFTVA